MARRDSSESEADILQREEELEAEVDELADENESDEEDAERDIPTSTQTNRVMENTDRSIVLHEHVEEDAAAILTPQQYQEFLAIGKVTDLEEGACQEGDVAVRAMLMAGYMRDQSYAAARHDAKEMERVAKWFNNQQLQEKSFHSGVTAAMNACVRGQLESFKVFLDGVDVNTLNDGGETFVMTAAAQGHLDVVDYLVRVHPGTDVTVKANSGGNLLTSAVAAGSERIVQYIIESEKCRDLDFDAMLFGRTALMLAACNGDVGLIEMLMLSGRCDEDKACESTDMLMQGKTALDLAVQAGNTGAAWRLERLSKNWDAQKTEVHIHRSGGGVALEAN